VIGALLLLLLPVCMSKHVHTVATAQQLIASCRSCQAGETAVTETGCAQHCSKAGLCGVRHEYRHWNCSRTRTAKAKEFLEWTAKKTPELLAVSGGGGDGKWQYVWQQDDTSGNNTNTGGIPTVQIRNGTCKALIDVYINWWGLIVPATAAEAAASYLTKFKKMFHQADVVHNQYVNGAVPCLVDASDQDKNLFDAGVISTLMRGAVSTVPVYPKVISFAGMWQEGVWHFLFEALSNVAPLLPIPTDVVVHVAKKTEWLLEWLNLVGVGEDFGHTIVDGSVRASTAMFPKLGACGGNSVEHIQFLRTATASRMDKLYGEPAPACNDLLLVRRTKTRQLSGVAFQALFERMEALAAEKGMTLTVFDDGYLSSHIIHQLHHFRRACAVVAPHGAGLTMLLGMQPGNCVIEVHPHEREQQYMYKSLASSLELQYATAEGGDVLHYQQDGGIDGGADAVETALRSCRSYAAHVRVPVR